MYVCLRDKISHYILSLQFTSIVDTSNDNSYKGKTITLFGMSNVMYNDRDGMCGPYDAIKGRYIITLTSGEKISIRPQNIKLVMNHQGYTTGNRVILHGLSCEKLNGLAGLCEEYDEKKERWLVHLELGEKISVRPSNMKMEETQMESEMLCKETYTTCEKTRCCELKLEATDMEVNVR